MISSKDFLKQIKHIVHEKEPSAKIYLFGSRARGTSTEESDWDLLILLNKDKVTFDDEKKLSDPLYELEFETGEVISPMIYSENEWNFKFNVTPFYNFVMREGKRL